MNQYFIESKQPIFVSFNRRIENSAADLDFDLLIKKFQENFEKELQENWLKYWQKQGEEQVLQKWNEKYKDFLKKQDCLAETERDDIKLEETNTSEEVGEANDILYEKSWEDLWQEHREKIYYLKKSFESTQPIFEAEQETQVVDYQLESTQLAQELEQLKILGLPKSFEGRPQNSGKKHKTPTIHYSDFFSDSDMDSDVSNESDVEDCVKASTAEGKEGDKNVQQKSLSKVAKRKRNRKLKNVPKFILEEKGLLKYWRKRFSLFSRFDEGIRLDRESWFSVTPEKVAKHLAERLKSNIIVDGFCGSGGNAIQFALTCDKVIAIDIDATKLEMAKHNAEIYKVSHKIEFILGDFLQLAAGGKLKADVVFISSPWGGPKYKNKKEFDIEKYLLPVSASEMVKVSRNVSENIALFLPRNSIVKQIIKLAGIGKRCEIEHNYLDSRLVAITALYGEEILTKQATN